MGLGSLRSEICLDLRHLAVLGDDHILWETRGVCHILGFLVVIDSYRYLHRFCLQRARSPSQGTVAKGIIYRYTGQVHPNEITS